MCAAWPACWKQCPILRSRLSGNLAFGLLRRTGHPRRGSVEPRGVACRPLERLAGAAPPLQHARAAGLPLALQQVQHLLTAWRGVEGVVGVVGVGVVGGRGGWWWWARWEWWWGLGGWGGSFSPQVLCPQGGVSGRQCSARKGGRAGERHVRSEHGCRGDRLRRRGAVGNREAREHPLLLPPAARRHGGGGRGGTPCGRLASLVAGGRSDRVPCLQWFHSGCD